MGGDTCLSFHGASWCAGTTHFSIIDKDRNVVAWTTTIEENLVSCQTYMQCSTSTSVASSSVLWVLSFMALPQGCGVVVPNRGFLMNNELTDFDPLPLNPLTGIPGQNRPEGGKKPRRTALGDDATTIGGEWCWCWCWWRWCNAL